MIDGDYDGHDDDGSDGDRDHSYDDDYNCYYSNDDNNDILTCVVASFKQII